MGPGRTKCSSVHTPAWSWEWGQALSTEWTNESRTRFPVRKKFSYQKKVWAVETRSHSKVLNKMLSVKLPGFTGGSVVKYPPAVPEMQEMWIRYLGWEDPLEEGMATHSSILAWRIPWAEEPGGLQSMGLQRVEHNWSDLAHMHANGQKVANDRDYSLGFVFCFTGLPRTSQLWGLGLASSDIFHV